MPSIFNLTFQDPNNVSTLNSTVQNWRNETGDDNADDYIDDFQIGVIFNLTNFTRSNSPPKTSFYNPQREVHNSVGVIVLAILLVVLSVLLTILMLHILRYRLMRRLLALRRLQQSEPIQPVNKEDRYAVIEEWLISKRVLKHDDACNRIMEADRKLNGHDVESASPSAAHDSPPRSPLSHKRSNSNDTSSASETREALSCGDENSCPICMSSFLVGEIISCSADEQCSHIYHHECIKEWLLNHMECPFCRNTFLDIDKPDHQLAKSPHQLTKRAQLSYCCKLHGLVEISPLLCQKQGRIMEDIERKVRGEMTLIQRGDLIVKRGARHALHEDKEMTVDEASIMCLASRDECSQPEKECEADDDLEANVQEQATTSTATLNDETDVAGRQYPI
ncbi:hypothetical protein MPSEU_000933400 [Mayamaea pseudoterrestris]|nr:hypothetical protein MPSEU_000933400 [Mayamaea pseudoterrestris]